MKINLLHTTFTGVDEKTSLVELEQLSEKFPYVEWGILYSESPGGSLGFNRYPSRDWFQKNKETIQTIRNKTGAKFSLHVCGQSVKKLLSQEDDFLLSLIPVFDRVQINFRYKEEKLLQLESLLNRFPDIQFITQHNNANKELWSILQLPNHQVLFDSSGGRGITAKLWDKPLSEKIFGYAGGLGVDNVTDELAKIASVTEGSAFWIDMENKIRTDDLLDLKKCEQVLVRVNLFWSNPKNIKKNNC